MAGPRSVVVVGAGLAGLRVCEALRRLGFDGRLTMFGAEVHPPYDRPPLSKDVLKGTRANPPILRPLDGFDALDVDLRVGENVLELDPNSQRIRLDSGSQVDYDVIVIATGARPRTLPMFAQATNAWTLRTAEDAAQIAELTQRGGRLAVLGAGFIGCEVAASAREMGCAVTVIEMLPVPLSRAVGDAVGAEIAQRLTSAGIDVRCGVTITDCAVGSDGRIGVLTLSDGARVEIDGLVVGLGVIPNVEWAQSSGLSIDDGIVCDERGLTSLPNVYAIGDVARWVNRRTGGHQRVEHWTTTVEHATIVAGQIAEGGHERRELDEVPYFWSDQLGSKIQCVGEPSASADVTVVHTGPDGTRPLYLYGQSGRLTGALGFSLASLVMRLRRLIADGATVDEALATIASVHPPVPTSANETSGPADLVRTPPG